MLISMQNTTKVIITVNSVDLFVQNIVKYCSPKDEIKWDGCSPYIY